MLSDESRKNLEDTGSGESIAKNISRRSFFRVLYVILGLICTGLGALGAALPVLPTTPFLLAAAFFFARSSERLNNRFKRSYLYKAHLESLVRGQGMSRPAKRRILFTVTLVMGVAEFFMLRAYRYRGSTAALVGAVVMALVWLVHVLVFMFVIKTCPDGNSTVKPLKGDGDHDAE